MENIINNNLCSHSYRRLQGCMHHDCQNKILFCVDCNSGEQKYHQKHNNELVSYQTFIKQISQAYNKITKDQEKILQDNLTKENHKIYKENKQFNNLISEQQKKIQDQKKKIEIDVCIIRNQINHSINKVQETYFDQLDNYMKNYTDQVQKLSNTIQSFEKNKFKFKFLQFPNFIKNKMNRLDGQEQINYLQNIRNLACSTDQMKIEQKDLKKQLQSNQQAIDKLNANMPSYNNNYFEKHLSKLNNLQKKYFGRNFINSLNTSARDSLDIYFSKKKSFTESSCSDLISMTQLAMPNSKTEIGSSEIQSVKKQIVTKKVQNTIKDIQFDYRKIVFCKIIDNDYQIITNQDNKIIIYNQNLEENQFKELIQMENRIEIIKVNKSEQYVSDILVYDGIKLQKLIYIQMKNNILQIKDDNNKIENVYKIKFVQEIKEVHLILCQNQDNQLISYQTIQGLNCIILKSPNIVKIKQYKQQLVVYDKKNNLYIYSIEAGQLKLIKQVEIQNINEDKLKKIIILSQFQTGCNRIALFYQKKINIINYNTSEKQIFRLYNEYDKYALLKEDNCLMIYCNYYQINSSIQFRILELNLKDYKIEDRIEMHMGNNQVKDGIDFGNNDRSQMKVSIKEQNINFIYWIQQATHTNYLHLNHRNDQPS